MIVSRLVRVLGRDIRWSDRPLETRSLEQITDIGIAFANAQAEILAAPPTNLPAVYRAVQLISDIAASLPLEAIGSDGVALPITPQVLLRPDPTTTYNASMRKIVASLLLRGNAYVWARTRSQDQQIQSVYVLNPDEVSVAWDRARLYPVYAWRDRNMEPNAEIFPIAINQWPGNLVGMGPIEASRLMFSGMQAEANLSRRLMEDEATPTGIVKVPRTLTQPEAAEVQTMWEESHGGRKRPAVLSGGAEFDPITINPVDAQFIEQRNFSIQEVGRLFGLDGFFLLVESGGSLTYSTTEQLLRLFLVMTLNPTYLEPIQQVFSLMLPEGISARFKTDEILTADIKSRYEAYAIGITNEFLDPDEVRRIEGRAPFDQTTRANMAARRTQPVEEVINATG